MASTGLKVTIVGGGLAGALSARVLRENHSVTVLERSKEPLETGAAVAIGPNGVKAMLPLGFDPQRTGSISVCGMRTWTNDGKMVQDVKLDQVKDYGAPWYFQHRVDLKTEFLRLATVPSEELGIGGKPATIRYDAKVVNVDVESGVVTLANGETIESDLVIAADGIKSIVRPLVVGDIAFASARPSGLSAFRFTLPRAVVLEQLPETSALDKNRPASLDMIVTFDDSQRTVVMYPCRNYEILNCVVIIPDSKLKAETTESWSAPGDRGEMLSNVQDFPSWVLDILNLAQDDIKLWQLRDQDPLPSYIRGRTVLIGDAAHPMTPHQGQGATQAVEDAEGFALFNDSSITREDVPKILRDFDSVRRPRASRIQDITRKSKDRKSTEDIHGMAKYNWTYPGIVEVLRRVKGGEDLVQF